MCDRRWSCDLGMGGKPTKRQQRVLCLSELESKRYRGKVAYLSCPSAGRGVEKGNISAMSWTASFGVGCGFCFTRLSVCLEMVTTEASFFSPEAGQGSGGTKG